MYVYIYITQSNLTLECVRLDHLSPNYGKFVESKILGGSTFSKEAYSRIS